MSLWPFSDCEINPKAKNNQQVYALWFGKLELQNKISIKNSIDRAFINLIYFTN